MPGQSGRWWGQPIQVAACGSHSAGQRRPAQFDFINGGNCKIAALAFAQFDAAGNVNVSRFGAANPGPGGFIDIAYNAETLLFTGTFTAGGLDVNAEDGRLAIVREGEMRKFPDQESILKDLNQKQCLPGRITPADLEPAFAFLASRESAAITGQCLTVDKGWFHE